MGNRKITSTLKSGTWFKRQKKKKRPAAKCTSQQLYIKRDHGLVVLHVKIISVLSNQ